MDVGRLPGGHDSGTVLASNGVGYLDRPRRLLSGRGRRVGLYTTRTRPADSSRSIDAGPASSVAVSRPYRAARACMRASWPAALTMTMSPACWLLLPHRRPAGRPYMRARTTPAD